MRILVSYRGAPRIRGWETGALLSRAFRQLGHEVDEYAKIYEKPEWVADRNDMLSKEYDLQVYCECNDSEMQYLELKNIDAKRRVTWLFDIAMQPDFYRRVVDFMAFDHCYVANQDYLHHFNCPTSYLPYAADQEFFYRDRETPKTIDVCLVGSDRKERRDLIKNLQKAGINAQLISGVFKEDYINTLAASKIVVNDTAGGGANLLSMRTFEAPAAGALLLQYEVPSMRDIMEDGICYQSYHNEESLINLSKYFLENEVLRNNIIRNGQYWILTHHTYLNRASEIIYHA